MMDSVQSELSYYRRKFNLCGITENYGMISIEVVPYYDDFDGVVLICHLQKQMAMEIGSYFTFP